MAESAAGKTSSAEGGIVGERAGCSSAGILHCRSTQAYLAGSRSRCEARSEAARTLSAWTTRHAEPATGEAPAVAVATRIGP